MKISLKGNTITATTKLDRNEWWLVCEGGEAGKKNGGWGIWTLNRKIDRSYKGKDPDVAIASLWLDPDIVEKLFDKLDVIWL